MRPTNPQEPPTNIPPRLHFRLDPVDARFRADKEEEGQGASIGTPHTRTWPCSSPA